MTNATSVKAKLRNVAEKENRPFDYILMHYFVERLLYRLSISTYADNFILKGGMLLYAMLDNDARATKDVDFLIMRIKNTQEELACVFTEICDVSSDDAIVFDASSITTQKIKEDADYEGVRVKLTGYLDKTRQVLQFDIGYGDAVVPHPLDIDYPSLLGMERPHLKAYSKESFIAEKFEAMLALPLPALPYFKIPHRLIGKIRYPPRADPKISCRLINVFRENAGLLDSSFGIKFLQFLPCYG